MKLSGKTALVTGAAKGIGFAICRRYAEEGASVFMADVDRDCLEKAAAELKSEGRNVFPCPCDITKTEEVQRAVEEAGSRGRIDILVNNAAIALGGNLPEMPEADWDRVLDTNLSSAFRFIKAVLPGMLRQKSGSVINISSVHAHRSWPGWTAYAAAKGGLVAMTRQLAGQYGSSHLRFNCISPGTIQTPMNEQRVALEGAFLEKAWIGMHAIPRLGQPDEVASLALYLGSDESAFISGQDILIDGGLSTLPRYIENPEN